MKTLNIGTSFNIYIEGNPDNKIEDVVVNTRPYVSVTPINDLDVRIYFDNVYMKSTDHFEQFVTGFLLAYNFMPKSWVYLAINDIQDRSEEYDLYGTPLAPRMHTTSRAGVLKIKYLYYF